MPARSLSDLTTVEEVLEESLARGRWGAALGALVARAALAQPLRALTPWGWPVLHRRYGWTREQLLEALARSGYPSPWLALGTLFASGVRLTEEQALALLERASLRQWPWVFSAVAHALEPESAGLLAAEVLQAAPAYCPALLLCAALAPASSRSEWVERALAALRSPNASQALASALQLVREQLGVERHARVLEALPRRPLGVVLEPWLLEVDPEVSSLELGVHLEQLRAHRADRHLANLAHLLASLPGERHGAVLTELRERLSTLSQSTRWFPLARQVAPLLALAPSHASALREAVSSPVAQGLAYGSGRQELEALLCLLDPQEPEARFLALLRSFLPEVPQSRLAELTIAAQHGANERTRRSLASSLLALRRRSPPRWDGEGPPMSASTCWRRVRNVDAAALLEDLRAGVAGDSLARELLALAAELPQAQVPAMLALARSLPVAAQRAHVLTLLALRLPVGEREEVHREVSLALAEALGEPAQDYGANLAAVLTRCPEAVWSAHRDALESLGLPEVQAALRALSAPRRAQGERARSRREALEELQDEPESDPSPLLPASELEYAQHVRSLVGTVTHWHGRGGVLASLVEASPVDWLERCFDDWCAVGRNSYSARLAVALFDAAPADRREEALAVCEQVARTPFDRADSRALDALRDVLTVWCDADTLLALCRSLAGDPRRLAPPLLARVLSVRTDLPLRDVFAGLFPGPPTSLADTARVAALLRGAEPLFADAGERESFARILLLCWGALTES